MQQLHPYILSKSGQTVGAPTFLFQTAIKLSHIPVPIPGFEKKAGLSNTSLSKPVAQPEVPEYSMCQCPWHKCPPWSSWLSSGSSLQTGSKSKPGLGGLGYQSLLTSTEGFFPVQPAPYLDAESLLDQPALGDAADVGLGGAVLDVQLFAGVLEGAVVHPAQVPQHLPPPVQIHQHAPTVTFVLQSTQRSLHCRQIVLPFQ